MHKKSVVLFLLSWIAALAPFNAEALPQKMSDVSSEHLLMRLPKERALLGRSALTDLERFYQFLNRALDIKLPRRIIFLVDWNLQESRTNYKEASIIIGMNQPVASNAKEFLLNESMRRIARFSLLELSKGVYRQDYEFLFEGMIEILVNEFRHTSRSLDSAWVLSQFLDETGLLGLNQQRAWTEFAGDRRSFRNAAPGITFLLTFRELKGREKPVKFFEALKRANLSRSLKDAFDDDADELEKIWLKTVRQYTVPEEITIEPDEAPQLAETVLSPETVSPGNRMKIRLLFKQNTGTLLPDGVFIRDERTGKLFPAVGDSGFISCEIPVEADAVSGQYFYRVTAIGESGNMRRWQGSYTIAGE